MAQITEEDILQGVLTRQDSYSGRIISKAPMPADPEKFKEQQAAGKKWREDVFNKLLRK